MKYILGLFVTAAAILVTGCGNSQPGEYVVMDGFALGTTYHFVLKTADSTDYQRDIDSIFNAVTHSMSVYEPNSLLNRLNRNETDSVDHDIAYLVDEAARISELSGGVYDITIKPLTDAWGFTDKKAEEQPNVDSLLQYVGYTKIRIVDGKLVKDLPEISLDLNSIAKGRTVDIIAEYFEQRAVTDYLVEIGGEVYCKGLNPKGQLWVIGVDKPEEGNFIPGNNLQVLISLTDKGLATSGNYRRYYVDEYGRKVAHTINAVTGMSEPGNLLSATVIADNATIADGFGTMFMAVGLERSVEILSSRDDLEAYLIFSGESGDYGTYITPSLKERLTK